LSRILSRYILREVALTSLGVTVVLLAIMLTNQLARVLERAAEFQYPRSTVMQLIALGAVQNLAVVVPVCLLLGIVLALGRLYHDSEMTAARACGLGRMGVVKPVLVLCALVVPLSAWLTLVLAPRAAARTYEMRAEAVRAGQFAPLAGGHFRSFGGGNTVIYAQDADAQGELLRVFVKRSREQRVEIAVAARARHEISADGTLHILTLFDGERYEGVPGQASFRIVRFAENRIPVRIPDAAGSALAIDALATTDLLATGGREQRAEFEWRVGLPVMAVVLSLLAVPLARLRPRQGRYGRIALAILAYFVYTNLMSAGRVWIARGTMPAWLGLWWVHLAIAALIIGVVWLPQWRARWSHRTP
jgi:lipopolysaccharide export system permease protein